MSSLKSICNPIQMFEQIYDVYLEKKQGLYEIPQAQKLKGCLLQEISIGLHITKNINGRVYSLPASRPGYYLLLQHILLNYVHWKLLELKYIIDLLFYLEGEGVTGIVSVFKNSYTYRFIHNLRETRGLSESYIFNFDRHNYENGQPVYTLSNTDVRMFLQSLKQVGGKKRKIKKTKNTKKKKTKRKHRKRKTFKKKTNKRK